MAGGADDAAPYRHHKPKILETLNPETPTLNTLNQKPLSPTNHKTTGLRNPEPKCLKHYSSAGCGSSIQEYHMADGARSPPKPQTQELELKLLKGGYIGLYIYIYIIIYRGV